MEPNASTSFSKATRELSSGASLSDRSGLGVMARFPVVAGLNSSKIGGYHKKRPGPLPLQASASASNSASKMSGTASSIRRLSTATSSTPSTPPIGAYFDVGNCMRQHQYPPHWIEILGSRIKRVHLKDFKRSVGTLDGFCDLLEGDQPWAETMAALRAIGYDRTLTAEMIPYAPGRVEKTCRAMRHTMPS
jgi:hypothetical protein